MRTAGLKQASAPAHVPRSVRVVRVPLAFEASPSEVLRAAGGDARPFALVGVWSGGGALVGSEPLVIVDDADDPFAVLDDQPEVTGSPEGATGGGWVGYLGYGLGRLVERLPPPPRRPVPVPGSMLAFYDHLLRRDEAGTWWFEALWSDEQSERLESRLSEWQRRSREPARARGEFACGPFLPSPVAEAHLVAVARAIEHIRSGDVYQVNVCARLEAAFAGDPLELFCAGADRLEPRFGAYLGHRSSAVASFSPELFLRRRGRQVLSSPIKGTARREQASLQQRERLLGSEKDRAENVMIVDLMRNDLGRVCRYGSVRVPDLCRAEEHPGVWHLVSDVTGELSDGTSDADLLRASFPPGSVTGAPKVRAMELLTCLEATSREVYTGAIGIASPLSGLELNVAIRTFEVARGRAWLGVGGGIVADSDPDLELEECLDKARPLLAAIGAQLDPTLVRPGDRARAASPDLRSPGSPDPESGVFETLLVLSGRPVDLESHLGRLTASVSCLYGSRPPARLGADVTEIAAGQSGARRLRVRVYPSSSGALETELSISEAPEAFSGVPGRAGRAGAGRRRGRAGPAQMARSPDPRRTAQRPRPRCRRAAADRRRGRDGARDRASQRLRRLRIGPPHAPGRWSHPRRHDAGDRDPGRGRDGFAGVARTDSARRVRACRGGPPHERDTGDRAGVRIAPEPDLADRSRHGPARRGGLGILGRPSRPGAHADRYAPAANVVSQS